MVNQNISNIKLAVFHNNEPIGVFKPFYMGMLGIFLENDAIDYPENTRLEIEILGSNEDSIESLRIPVTVSCKINKGIGLKLEHYNQFHNRRWRMILNRIMYSQMQGKAKKVSAVF
jgi:hypothetical protein